MLYLDYSPRGRRVDAQRVRRPREPRGGAVPPGDERHRLQARARARSRSPRSRPPGPASPGRPRPAAWASASSGTWAGCTTRSATCQHDPVHRSYHHDEMTFSLVYACSENYVLPISHDEVVHGKGSLLRKMPGDRWQQLANLRAYLAFMWAHPGKQLLFMGIELGQESEWAEARELDWWLLDHPEHRGVHDLVRDLNRAYVDSPALWSRDDDAGGVRVDRRQRRGPQRVLASSGTAPRTAADLVCVANFAAVAARRLPPRPALGRQLGRGPQHRRRGLHRLRRRQPRRGRGGRGRAGRPARVRHRGRAAARHRVVPQATAG